MTLDAPGYTDWDGVSEDAADTEGNDLDREGWIPRVVYEPWAVSGDMPGPDDVPEELYDDPQWAIFLCGSEDGDIDVEENGLTLAEALNYIEEVV